ncbi:MAG: hypothetical protein J5616_06710 [Bacteroidaceae bacterium]|nr:hypothetical protein [Bacteroidaceae bacterium]
MMKTKNIFLAALTLMSVMTANVNAQNANETPQQKFERLAKAADEDPTNWQKQKEVGEFLINHDEGMYDQVAAMKYFERIYHLVADVNREVPDSVFEEAGIVLMFTAMNQKDMKAAMFYGDELNRYVKVTNNEESTSPMTVNTVAVLLEMADERILEAADRLSEVRKELSRREFQGVEHTDMLMCVLYDQVFSEYKKFVENKLMEITIDGKPYVILAMGEWNVEQPLMGWVDDTSETAPVLMGEDGVVRDDLHGQILFNFNWSEKDMAVVKSDDTNTRIITVTPERRQQLIEAYKKFLKKGKK